MPDDVEKDNTGNHTGQPYHSQGSIRKSNDLYQALAKTSWTDEGHNPFKHQKQGRRGKQIIPHRQPGLLGPGLLEVTEEF